MSPTSNEPTARNVANPTDEDYADAARRALQAKDFAHGFEQISAAVAANPLHAPHVRLLDDIIAAAKDPLAWLKLPERDAFFGLCAARGRTLARLGRVDEALDCLFQAATFRPETPFLPWGVEWVARAAGAKRARPAALAARMVLFTDAARSTDPVEGVRINLEAAVAIADEVQARHPSNAPLRVALSRTLRSLGRREDALERLGPRDVASWEVAVECASLHRELGDAASRIHWLERAGEARPSEPSTYLDLGDAHLDDGDLEAARTAYARAQALEPDSEWACVSDAYAKALESRAEVWTPLSGEGASDAGRERARALDRDLGAYTCWLVDPVDPVAGVIRAAHARARSSDSPARLVVRVRADGPLAPSARTAFDLAMKICGRDGRLTVEHEARAQRDGPLWSTGDDAIPPAEPDVIDHIARIARTPFSWTRWSRLAAEGATGEASAVMRAMAHPPDPPSRDADVVSWVHGFQIAAALVLASLPAGDPTGLEALGALLEGADDWSSAAALLGLRALAREDATLAGGILARLAPLLPDRASHLSPYALALAVVGCELATGDARRPFLRLRARVRSELGELGEGTGEPERHATAPRR